MSIQFPDTPTEGQTFTASNGVIYTYEDGGWKANAVSGLDDSYVNRTGDTMTGDLTVPNLISEGDVQTTSLNGGQLAGFRNQFINGGMDVIQRGENFTFITNNKIYTTDRWCITEAQNGATFAVGGQGFTNSVGIASWLHLTSTSTVILCQAVELPFVFGAGRSPYVPGAAYTISFVGPAGLATPSVNVRWSDNTKGDNMSDAGTGGYAEMVEVNIDSSYSKYVLTFNVAGAPIASNRCLFVAFKIQPDLINATPVSNFQFEPGPVATPFEHRPIGTELALCQRYFQKAGYGWTFGTASNITYVSGNGTFSVEMRSTPTVAQETTALHILGASGGPSTTDLITTNTGIMQFVGNARGVSRLRLNGLADLPELSQTYALNTENKFSFDAEL